MPTIVLPAPHGTARVKHVGGVGLIVAQNERLARKLAAFAQAKLERRAVHVTGQVLCRVAHLQQRPLEVTALSGGDKELCGRKLLQDKRSDELVPGQLRHQGQIVTGQHQGTALRMPHELDAPVARDRVGNVHAHVFRQRILAEAFEVGDDAVRGHTGGGGVPQRKRRDPVRVDVLGTFFQLGKAGQRITRGLVLIVVNFE